MFFLQDTNKKIVNSYFSDEVWQFLDEERVCCFVILLPDGSPHATAMHFAFSRNAPVLFFGLNKKSLKYDALKERLQSLSSVVIGFREDKWKTLQLNGIVELLSKSTEDYKSAVAALIARFGKNYDEHLLGFSPSKWRYVDYTQDPIFIQTHFSNSS